MNESIYNVLFGALTQEQRMNTIANNLANADTVGFKREKQAFKDVFARFWHDKVDWTPSIRTPSLFPQPEMLSQNRVALNQTDFTSGNLKQTGNSLDVALSGEGFFKVRTNAGEFYTRNGSFKLGTDGTLLTQNGFEVLGQDGSSIRIRAGGQVSINEGGQIYRNDEAVGALAVVSVDRLDGLEKVGGNLFRIRSDYGSVNEIPATNAVVSQGFLEMSNVSVVEEMVSMIDASRIYESYSKVMATTQDSDKKSINEVGLTR